MRAGHARISKSEAVAFLFSLRILCDLCGLGFGKIKVKPFTAKNAKDSAKDAKKGCPTTSRPRYLAIEVTIVTSFSGSPV
jgi:hypothetical protein